MAYFDINIAGWVDDFRTIVGGQRIVNDSTLLTGGFSIEKHIKGDILISGIPEVLKNWEHVSADMKEMGIDQMRFARDQIKEQSQWEVPYRSGALQASWYDQEIDIEGSHPIIEMGYDPNLAIDKYGESYAWMQHENLMFEHPTPGTKAHYLSDPFQVAADKFADDVRVEVKKVVTGLGPGTGGPRLVKKPKV